MKNRGKPVKICDTNRLWMPIYRHDYQHRRFKFENRVENNVGQKASHNATNARDLGTWRRIVALETLIKPTMRKKQVKACLRRLMICDSWIVIVTIMTPCKAIFSKLDKFQSRVKLKNNEFLDVTWICIEL
ncbi:hypothetical protein L6164_033468 [Bauhinia variegata]|uniref:Uncharacterized protein n=1 Tax=Bauhinia variegata TaxID=167791 RepID=A0ACB9KSH6_BAUVA|nr:hypothetical protein L6164_033468 [Bauhinia variegata]